MELLIGVAPDDKWLEYLVNFIYQNFPQGPKSMMLEIPPNINSLEGLPGIWEGTYFFNNIGKVFKKNGTEVIYGDLPLEEKLLRSKKIDMPLWKDVLDIFIKTRGRNMTRIIRHKNPEIVIACPYITDYIKRKVPDVAYVWLK